MPFNGKKTLGSFWNMEFGPLGHIQTHSEFCVNLLDLHLAVNLVNLVWHCHLSCLEFEIR